MTKRILQNCSLIAALFLCMLMLVSCGNSSVTTTEDETADAPQQLTSEVEVLDTDTDYRVYAGSALLLFDNSGSDETALTPLNDASADASSDASASLTINGITTYHTFSGNWNPDSFIINNSDVSYIIPVRFAGEIDSIEITDVSYIPTSASGDAVDQPYQLHTNISLTESNGSRLASDNLLFMESGTYTFTASVTENSGAVSQIDYTVEVVSDSFASDLIAGTLPQQMIVNPRSDAVQVHLVNIRAALLSLASDHDSDDAQILAKSFFLRQLNLLINAFDLASVGEQELIAAANTSNATTTNSTSYNYSQYYYYDVEVIADDSASDADDSSDDNSSDDSGNNNSDDNRKPNKPSDDSGGNNKPDTPSDDSGGNNKPDTPSDDSGGNDTPDTPSDGGDTTPDTPSDGGDTTPDIPVDPTPSEPETE